jgi:hypothetical protein
MPISLRLEVLLAIGIVLEMSYVKLQELALVKLLEIISEDSVGLGQVGFVFMVLLLVMEESELL